MPDILPVCKQNILLRCKSEVRAAEKIIVHPISAAVKLPPLFFEEISL